ncbi:hypothetical protein [Streptomyces sp. NBC_01198]|uniref:hypothetical protein n=1 Tax=Streptomyces sp. NBC_01198 TaxID=2903769 RepID=UPI002E1476DD|nr:hypothetical protein OG702_13155 [Streptomyces sp. NBC_01198]
MSIRKMSARATVLLACAVVLTACNSGDDSDASDTAPPATTASPATSAPSTPAATTAAADAAGSGGAVADGSKLKTLLPTAATAPKGWKLDDSAAYDTGANVKSPTSALLPDDDCSQALTNGGAKTLTSDYSAAYAMAGLTGPNDGSSTVIFNSYQPGAAAKQMAEVTALAKRCATFSAQDMSGKNVKLTVTATPVAGAGDQSLDLKIQPAGKYVGSEIVLIASGNVIMGVDEADAAGAMTPLAPVAEQLAAGLPLK